ncbi:uncharacterized protein MELLADRAFT_61685 [Melampsora larici-populina 98AG31]|uniref:Integrase zinc-binding domain-containing protein n=1 Tax=Melampsora larici-populina (strain 98AG31 / pathotype 3-4-7) TaxID=747676 RepID=F4RFW8_MELLP|nr:uncharacterized protein MELLADRAFT_61685 [Melampsora larici-populina 98AG31]EGG08424.1 hypothetical protein MELLADRAFT_61685 [Melampsora larici-populina 98AG31]
MNPTLYQREPHSQSMQGGETEQSISRNPELIIMSCTNGSDGFPAQIEFNRRMENYISRKKRAERTVVNDEELASIHRLLSDPAAMRAETDVSHRTWVKKTFCLRPSLSAGSVVCHRDKGQTIPQPIASKEQMYFILKKAHASEGHGGRDKTAKAVKKTHSFIRKGLICLFLEVCPTCRVRNDAVKKDKPNNTGTFSGISDSHGGMSLGPWGMDTLHPPPPPDLGSQGFFLGKELGPPGMNPTHTSGRRPPTLTEATGAAMHSNLNHLRNNTYPQVDMAHGSHMPTSDYPLNSLELPSQHLFNSFSASDYRNPQISVHQPQIRPPFVTMQPDTTQLNHSNMLQHNNQQMLLQQQMQMQLQFQQFQQFQQQAQLQDQRPMSASPRLPDSVFQAQQQDEAQNRQQYLSPRLQQTFDLRPQNSSNSSSDAFLQQSQYQAQQPPPLTLLASNNIYDPTNASFLLNQTGSEELPLTDNELLRASADLNHVRIPSNISTNEKFGALALRDASVGSNSNPHSRYASSQGYQPGPPTANSDLVMPSSGLRFEHSELFNQPQDGFDYQSSSGPSTGVSFWTRPDEMPNSGLTAGVFTAGLESCVAKPADEGNHQRSSTIPEPSPEGKRRAAFKPLISFSQHRCGSAPPPALLQTYKSNDPNSLSVNVAAPEDEDGLSSDLPRSAPATLSSSMEKSLNDFFSQMPEDGALSDEMLHQLLGADLASSSEDAPLFPSDNSLSFPTLL